MASWSSLRINRHQEYNIYSSFWGKRTPWCPVEDKARENVHVSDRREAAPRIIRRPHNTHVLETNNATFDCRIIALSPPVVSWYQCSPLTLLTVHCLRFSGSAITLNFVNRWNTSRNTIEITTNWRSDAAPWMTKANTSYGQRTAMEIKNTLCSSLWKVNDNLFN